jgi:hypothetical protein
LGRHPCPWEGKTSALLASEMQQDVVKTHTKYSG